MSKVPNSMYIKLDLKDKQLYDNVYNCCMKFINEKNMIHMLCCSVEEYDSFWVPSTISIWQDINKHCAKCNTYYMIHVYSRYNKGRISNYILCPKCDLGMN